MPRRQSTEFGRKLQLLVNQTPAYRRPETRRAVEVLMASRIQSQQELVGMVEAETSERNLREIGCWAVGRLRPRGWTASIGRVVTTARDVGLAHTAVEGLVAKRSSTAVKVLRQALVRGRSPAGRAEAAWGLGVLHAQSAVGSLIRVILRQGEDSRVRAEAVEALVYIRDRRAVRPLLRTLEDSDPRIRCEAIFALGNLGDRRAVPALDKLLGDTTEVANLGQIGTAVEQAKQTIEMLNPIRSRKAERASHAPRRAGNAGSRPKTRPR